MPIGRWRNSSRITRSTVAACDPAICSGRGTLSGPRADQAGSLLELAKGGSQPLTLSNGERRGFLEDDDTVILRGYCEREGFRRIGFGECRGSVLAAAPRP